MRPVDKIVRAALKLGEFRLIPASRECPPHWRFGRRQFNYETITRAIDRGDAVREGNVVRQA